MGTIQHNVVVATTWDKKEFYKVIDWVLAVDPEYRRLFVWSNSIVNNYHTVVMCPDGSKLGWKTCDEAQVLRENFIKELGNHWKYTTLSYGELGTSLEL